MNKPTASALADIARKHVESLDNIEVLTWAIWHANESGIRNRIAAAAVDVLHVFILERLLPEAAQLSAALNNVEDTTDAGQ
mgnify:CR=1 FL=1